MKITFAYFAQIRQQAGVETETLMVVEGTTVGRALQKVEHGAGFHELLFDAAGALRPMMLLVVNGLPAVSERVLRDGDHVQIFSPVSGG